MDLPAPLPENLRRYEKFDDILLLLKELIAHPAEFLPFFISACGDETWTDAHSEFAKEANAVMTHYFIENRLPPNELHQVIRALQRHYAIQKAYIPHDVTFIVENEAVQGNAMLFGACCDHFNNAIRHVYTRKAENVIELPNVTSDVFKRINEYVCTGTVDALWRMEPDSLLNLLRQASIWQIPELMHGCQQVLKQYVETNNAFDLLVMSTKGNWIELKRHVCEFINEQGWGIRVGDRGTDTLAFEFLDFKEKTMEKFSLLQPYITHLIVSQTLTEESGFSEVVNQCPRMISLDISRSAHYTERLLDIPRTLQQLDISQCLWLTRDILKELFAICPNLDKLTINNDGQLSFLEWGELSSLKRLTFLDISRCNQLTDDDFKVILQACKGIKELVMVECKTLTDRAFYDIARVLTDLKVLNISRCSLYDAALIELAIRLRSLAVLDVTRCDHLTPKGLAEAARHATALRTFIISQCKIHPDAVEQLRLKNPYVTIVY